MKRFAPLVLLVSCRSAEWWGPRDFDDSKAVIAVTGPARLVVVPGVTAGRWSRENLDDLRVAIDVAVEAGPGGARGRPLPEPRTLAPKVWRCPSSGPKRDPAQERTFRVYDGSGYVEAKGRLAHAGSTFVFYEDPANRENFTAEEYAAIDRVPIGEIHRLFGEPTDFDGNGRFAVFVSRTVQECHPDGQAYFDGEDLRTGAGEILYIWALDGFAHTPRADLVRGYYPRNLLHEAVHVCQYSHSIRKTGRLADLQVPAYAFEGPAELGRFLFGFQPEESWAAARRGFAERDPAKASPYFYPYDLGALVFWRLHRAWGEGIHQAMLNGVWESGDFLERATGVPEPLHLAMAYDWMREEAALPVVRLRPGDRHRCERSYTGFVILEIDHEGPVRVTLDVPDADRAFVVGRYQR